LINRSFPERGLESDVSIEREMAELAKREPFGNSAFLLEKMSYLSREKKGGTTQTKIYFLVKKSPVIFFESVSNL
jgi:hypothetical protein